MVLLVLFLAFGAGAAAAAYVFRLPVVVTKEVPVLKYRHRAAIDYRVRLKANNYYPAPVLGPGGTYLANFVQAIETLFTYRFAAGEKVALEGGSKVTATIEALTKEGEKSRTVWERSFALAPPQEFREEGKRAALGQRLLVDLNRYNQLVESLGKEAGVSFSEARLVLKWDVRVRVSSVKGTAYEALAPTLVIPLSQKAFAAGGEPVAEKAGAFTTEQKLRLSMREKLRYSILAYLAVVGFVLLLFTLGTQGEQVSAAEKVRRVIYKRHGAFLVEVTTTEEESETRVVSLATIDDLVKVADELGKPVLHQKSAVGEDLFCVLDGPVRYEFRLED